MTIHTTHPFADAEPDPVRRLRGRLAASVTLLTSGAGAERSGLTVSSLLVANGEPARVLALVDPDSDLADAVHATGAAVVQLLGWEERDLAEAFAGTAPAPGGLFRQAAFEDTGWGPRLTGARTWAGLRLEGSDDVGWSSLLRLVVEEATAPDAAPPPLLHHRGRYRRVQGDAS